MAKASRSKPLKYADKSDGQPEMADIFHAIKKILSGFAKGNFIVKSDKPGCFELYYNKKVEIMERTYPELCFASLLVQKGYVGFYYFPVYVNPALKKKLAPELLQDLKGKTCFHIKKNDPGLFSMIYDALNTGRDFYTSRGWK
jgi:hypothetical protein